MLEVFSTQRNRTRTILLLAACGVLVSVILHNVFDAVASGAGPQGLAHDLLNGVGVVFFFVAILLCPPAFLVGAVGAVVMSGRERAAGASE